MLVSLVTILLYSSHSSFYVLLAMVIRTVAEEPKRFQMLVLSLTDEPINPIYQVITEILVCVYVDRNQLFTCYHGDVGGGTEVHQHSSAHTGPSARVFHQYEFVDTGFSVPEIEQVCVTKFDNKIMFVC